MATAINFNWVVLDKMTTNKVYDVKFTAYNGTTTDLQISKVTDSDGVFVAVWIAGTDTTAKTKVFRRDMRVSDALALLLQKSGRATSGEVYKCDILTEMNEEYESNEVYTARHESSHHFETNKPNKDSEYYLGFELETIARNTRCYNSLCNMRSNIWRMVYDSSIGSEGIEYVSTLIHPSDAIKPDFYEHFCDMLTGLAVSSSRYETGLHCHISRAAFGDTEEEENENIAKLCYMESYILDTRALRELYGRDESESYASKNESPAAEHVTALRKFAPKILAAEGVKDALCADFLRANKTRRGHSYGCDRYHKINVTNQQTIEFRQGKGQIKSQVIANIAQHAVTIAKYCRETPWHKLSARGYWNSIPNSNKYAELKRIFSPQTDE